MPVCACFTPFDTSIELSVVVLGVGGTICEKCATAVRWQRANHQSMQSRTEVAKTSFTLLSHQPNQSDSGWCTAFSEMAWNFNYVPVQKPSIHKRCGNNLTTLQRNVWPSGWKWLASDHSSSCACASYCGIDWTLIRSLWLRSTSGFVSCCVYCPIRWRHCPLWPKCHNRSRHLSHGGRKEDARSTSPDDDADDAISARNGIYVRDGDKWQWEKRAPLRFGTSVKL